MSMIPIQSHCALSPAFSAAISSKSYNYKYTVDYKMVWDWKYIHWILTLKSSKLKFKYHEKCEGYIFKMYNFLIIKTIIKLSTKRINL